MASFLSRGGSQKKGKGKSKARNCAGIALHGDSARYVELSGTVGALQVVKQQVAPIARGAIVKDSLVDLEGVVSALEALKSAVGGFRCPVALGIPSRDVILRLIEYPKMSVEEVGEALQFEFDKYFPYPYQEAAADIAEVEVPSHDAVDKTIVLVATSKQRVVHDMMRMASKAGISLSAVEPLNVAFFRAAIGPFGRQGGYFVVFVEPETTQIVLGYKDNGILFRSAAVDLTSREVRESDEGILPILRDVQNTIIFAGNQYKELTPDVLILGGIVGKESRLAALLESGASVSVEFLDVWERWKTSPASRDTGFEAAFGLAVRELL
ncbi:MAG: pilus assembly protein PilM [Synergistaceae bacterium]|jgi:type IV pilus assembly protein PilM|nr:pilus assembly protein PilM [Synergistaceae bacterium]